MRQGRLLLVPPSVSKRAGKMSARVSRFIIYGTGDFERQSSVPVDNVPVIDCPEEHSTVARNERVMNRAHEFSCSSRSVSASRPIFSVTRWLIDKPTTAVSCEFAGSSRSDCRKNDVRVFRVRSFNRDSVFAWSRNCAVYLSAAFTFLLFQTMACLSTK